LELAVVVGVFEGLTSVVVWGLVLPPPNNFSWKNADASWSLMTLLVPVVLETENNRNKNKIVANPDKKTTNLTVVILFSCILN
jgi:hypothetical protein